MFATPDVAHCAIDPRLERAVCTSTRNGREVYAHAGEALAQRGRAWRSFTAANAKLSQPKALTGSKPEMFVDESMSVERFFLIWKYLSTLGNPDVRFIIGGHARRGLSPYCIVHQYDRSLPDRLPRCLALNRLGKPMGRHVSDCRYQPDDETIVPAPLQEASISARL